MEEVLLPGTGFDTYEEQDKVLVGMSGGVDSSVTVRILQDQGFAVVGAVIRFSPAHEKAVQEAKAAAQQLGVPCVVLDAQDMFEQRVVAPFCESYCAGKRYELSFTGGKCAASFRNSMVISVFK